MTKNYLAADIEVLTGLDPVRKRPGMYTDTSRPNHLAHEVIDNSVDEAIEGHAKSIKVKIHKDGSLEVADDGRGMPVDMHPKEKISGVELILTKLHSGAKFTEKNYQFSGGLHGVGVSVVNALSKNLEIWIKRDGKEYNQSYVDGKPRGKLEVIGKIGKNNSGTTIRFWPNPDFFDNPSFSINNLKHNLRAKAVLCPGLNVSLNSENPKFNENWHYQSGLEDYLISSLKDSIYLPKDPISGSFQAKREAAEWSLVWHREGLNSLNESYVNLVPTLQGGTHVNGLRSGITEALRDFCNIKNLIPRGLKISPEDVWEDVSFILSVKMIDPQFSGQTKERLSSRECAGFMASISKDSFSLWLNQNQTSGEEISNLVIEKAQARIKNSKKVTRKKITSGPALPGKLSDCTSQETSLTELFLVEGDSAGGSAKQARNREFQAVMPLRGKILNTWELESNNILNSQEVSDISVALGVEPGSSNLDGLRYNKICILADADSDGLHIATLLCALFLKHFQPLVSSGHIYVAMPPLYRIDVGKEIFYALDDAERAMILDRIETEGRKGKLSVTRFKGLGEMNPLQLRETTMATDTRRLTQLTIDDLGEEKKILDMLLSKKRSADRRAWLEEKGNLANL
ncbi:MAG: DNA topoisomerase IV subunit B [Pseudomonadota bacterium]|nr:DNA topoisomerase IV subunit B [Gammaproteobacteria bacterium]MEE2683943.1 DNA topoisomerase IV subunit B [Pseudomonadota bacterium]|tara:strand:- start:3396 stop:5282 length:1887 start_codon:yes stop_codon:yes gene_type:complete